MATQKVTDPDAARLRRERRLQLKRLDEMQDRLVKREDGKVVPAPSTHSILEW